MAALLTWTEAYSVGHPMLDADHRIIFSLLAQLHDATDTDQSREVVSSVLNVLTDYTEHHFRREERLMVQIDYPHRDAHRQKHHDLERHVGAIRSRWAAGERDALNAEVLDLLKKWLTGHILEDDKAYEPWVEAASAEARLAEDPTTGRDG